MARTSRGRGETDASAIGGYFDTRVAMGTRGEVEERRGNGNRRSRPRRGRGEADNMARWIRVGSAVEPWARRGKGEAEAMPKAGEVGFVVDNSAKRGRVVAGMRRNRWRDEGKRCRVKAELKPRRDETIRMRGDAEADAMPGVPLSRSTPRPMRG